MGKDEQKYGEYRTKRVILECYDAMAEAMNTEKPYQTILDPPPGPPCDESGNFIPMEQWTRIIGRPIFTGQVKGSNL